MKSFKFFSFLILLMLVAFSSCKKDEINTTEVVPDPINSEETYSNGLLDRLVADAEELSLGCVTVEYPFSMLMMDSSTIEITSEGDMNAAFMDSTNYPIDFVYPLNVTSEDGSTFAVNNAGELAALFANCVPDTGWDDSTFTEDFFPAWVISLETSCYELVYPVTILNVDGATATAANEDELVLQLSDGNFYSFSFPLNLIDADGNPVIADDGNALFDLLAACNPGGGIGGGCNPGGFACYQFSYPITLVMIDGSTVTINSDDEFANAVMNGEWAGFQYPITLIAEDSTELVVNNDDELNGAMLNCGGFIGGGGGGDSTLVNGDFICYNFVYPIQITDFTNGTVTNIADETAWYAYLSNGNNVGFEFVFPLGLIHVETGATLTANNYDELTEAMEDCF